MDVVIGTAIVFAVVTLAMSVGVIFSGRSLKGSCGGPGGECPCDDAARKDCSLKRGQGETPAS